jgi:predicted esterase
MTISGIPVLLVIGDSDHVFDPSNESLQDTRMTTGGAQVTATTIGGAGHAITLGLSHLQFVNELSRWLTASGF